MAQAAFISNSPKTDAELMSRAAQGDRAAFGQIVHRHQDRLFNALLRLCGDPEEAAELAHQTFSRSLARLDEFRGQCPPYAWLLRLAMSLGISALRKSRRPRAFDAGGPAQSGAADLLAAMGRLETDYRAVLILRDVESLDYQQMAEVLGTPPATVKSRLFRARLALRDEMLEPR